MKRISLYIAGSLLLLNACSDRPNGSAPSERVTRVRVIHPEYITRTASVGATGMLATRQEMKLSFKTGGIVKTVPVREGQPVKKGAILASLDLSEIEAQARQTSVALEKAERDLQRARNLHRDSVVTLETLQNAESAFEMARAQKKIADFNLKHSYIVAPSQGKIQKVMVEKNEMIAPGYPAILFASTDNDWIVRIAVSDKDIVKIDVGDSAAIRMDPFPGVSFRASVSEVGAVADPVTGTYEAELQLDAVRPEFRTGFIARVDVYPETFRKGWWVPMEAVVDAEDHRGFVFLADGTSARKTEVVTGGIVDDGMLIISGISGEDIVITEGASYLEDGADINIITTIN